MNNAGSFTFIAIVLILNVSLSGAQDVLIKSHYNESTPSTEVRVKYNDDNQLSRPEGFNDKYHGPGWNNKTTKNSHEPNNHYYLVPPFIIGASVAIVLYIVCNCFYLHCYAHRKIKTLAERHFSHPILLADEASSGAYQAFTPIAYDEGDDTGQFLFYQPINENEWEVSVEESSSRGSVRSKSSLRKKSLANRIFGKTVKTSTSSAPEETQGSKRSIRLVPFNRSLSAPAKASTSTARVVYAPVMIPRIQSVRNNRGNVKNTSSDSNILPQTPLLILGKGEGKGKVLFRNVVPENPENDATFEARGGTTENAEKPDEAVVTFHLPEVTSDDAKSPYEEKEDVV